ncbi:ATP-binding protein [Sulfuricaulis sp.]|uniref:ATP-binding protein n=1 Tax=Sulfuricaulis sp. TaxID=2003553 RepID=UPI00345E0305
MVLSARTWVELPPVTRTDFEHELKTNHGLTIGAAREPLPPSTSYLHYRFILEAALTQRLNRPVPVHTTADPTWYWADIPAGGKMVRVGFARERIGASPPAAIALLLAAIAALTLITALILARRLTRPLAQLAQAATRVGQGETPEPLPEQGPEELAQLARRFNRMVGEVRELLANRTTLLSGISHDLRTPLARMQLALEMLPRAVDAKLVDGLRRDVEEIDRLIGQFLELGHGLEAGQRTDTDLRALLEDIAADARRSGAEIHLNATAGGIMTVNAMALRRILANLVENAMRYGGGKPVDIELEQSGDANVIRVLDRGPGIPESEREAVFRPFHRLEPSRSAATGGSGLGLAVARQLAQANGWNIELLARPGGGTEARLTLATSPRTNDAKS